MFNPLNLLSKIIKSGNQKELDRIGKIVNQINGLEKKFENIDNSDFPKKTSELIARLKSTNAKNLYALITYPNKTSINLHKTLNFIKVGILNNVGYKFKKYWSVHIYELKL